MSAAGRSLRARIRQVNSEQADDLRIVQTASDDLKHRSFSTHIHVSALWNISVAHLIGLDVGRPDHPDVNADGKADIVDFGADGVYMALATGGGHFASADIPTLGLCCQCRRLEQRQRLPAPAGRHQWEWIGRHHRLRVERRSDRSVLDVNGHTPIEVLEVLVRQITDDREVNGVSANRWTYSLKPIDASDSAMPFMALPVDG